MAELVYIARPHRMLLAQQLRAANEPFGTGALNQAKKLGDWGSASLIAWLTSELMPQKQY